MANPVSNGNGEPREQPEPGTAAPATPLQHLQTSPERQKLWDAISMSVSFGERPVAFKEILFRLLVSDPSLTDLLVLMGALRGIDPAAGDLHARLGMRLFEKKRGKVAEKIPLSSSRACLGSLLHLARGAAGLSFSPGTLFEQREVSAAEGEDAPKLKRVTDSSQGLQYSLKRVVDNAPGKDFLHVASVHRRALLPPEQVEFLHTMPTNDLTLDHVEDLAGAANFDVGADVVTASLAEQVGGTETLKKFWASHAAAYPDAKYVQEEYAWSDVATFQRYCYSLYRIAASIWAQQRHLWSISDGFDALERVVKEARDAAETREPRKGGSQVEAEIYAEMHTVAEYAKGAGVLADTIHHGGNRYKWLPGQHNLLGIAQYWVSHATDAVNPGDDNANQRWYLDAVYDFFHWAGLAGLFAFYLPGTVVPAVSLDDLGEVAASEGIAANLKMDENAFTRNPKMHAVWPFPIPPPKGKGEKGKKTSVPDDSNVQHAMKILLFQRLERIFEMLKVISWQSAGKQGVNAMVRDCLSRKASAWETPSGFEWVRVHLPTRERTYGQKFLRTSYRYFVNYIGGMLAFFPQYVASDLGATSGHWKAQEGGILQHPLDRWRYYLEIAYMLTVYMQQTTGQKSKKMASIVTDILPILVGGNVGEDMKNAVARVRPPKGLKVASKGMLASIAKKDWDNVNWDRVLEKTFDRLVAEAERGRLEETIPGTPADPTNAAEYLRAIQVELRPFLVRYIARIRLLRHFYRTHYVYFDPAAYDFLPPSYLAGEISEASFHKLLAQEAEARRIAGRVITGGERRVRVEVPREIVALLSSVVLDAKGTPSWQAKPVEAPEGKIPELPEIRGLEGQEYRIVHRCYQENGHFTEYAINEHVWHVIQHEVNQQLGRHVGNWQVFASRVAQLWETKEQEVVSPIGRSVVDDVTPVAEDQVANIARSARLMVRATRALLEELPSSFRVLAGFAFANYLPKEFVTSLKEKITASESAGQSESGGRSLGKVTNREIKIYAQMIRNLFDQPEGVTKGDSLDWTFPHALGAKLNRKHLGPRLDALYARMRANLYSREGDITDENEEKLAILSWGHSKRFLLHLCAENVAGGDASIPLPKIFADTWGADKIHAAMASVPEDSRQDAQKLRLHYPRFEDATLPAGGRQIETTRQLLGLAGREGASPDQTNARDELLLAVMKGLVVDLERQKQSGESKQQDRNLKAKLLRMIYAHEALVNASPADLSANELTPGGLRFLIDVPSILPSIAFARALGWAVSDIVRNPFVADVSLTSVQIANDVPLKVINPDPSEEDEDEEEESESTEQGQAEAGEMEDVGNNKTVNTPWTLAKAEAFHTRGFNAGRKNYGDAVQEILAVLAVGQAFGADSDTWQKFASGVAEAWKERTRRVKDGERGKLKAGDPFQPLADAVQSGFRAFAAAMEKQLQQLEKGEIRSLYQQGNPALKQLPIWESRERPTLGPILPFDVIERKLVAGVPIPLSVIMRDVKQDPGWTWTVGESRQRLTAVFPPGTIPFCIECPPLTADELEECAPDVEKFFGMNDENLAGQKRKNPLRPEVESIEEDGREEEEGESEQGLEDSIEGAAKSLADFSPAIPTDELEKRKKKLENRKARCEKNLEKVWQQVEGVLKRMNKLREFEQAIKRRLVRRRAVIITFLKLGLDASAIAAAFTNVTPEESWFTSVSDAESDAISEFLKGWTAGKDDPAKVAAWVKEGKSIQQDDAGAPSDRVDAFLSSNKTSELAALLGLTVEQVKTWDASECRERTNKILRRASQLIGLLDFHLTRLGFSLRGLRARQKYYPGEIAQLGKDIGTDADTGGSDHASDEQPAAPPDLQNVHRKIRKLLRGNPLYVAYRGTNLLPCAVKIGKGVPVLKQPDEAEEGQPRAQKSTYALKGRLMERLASGASIGGLQIQVPKYPSMTVAASVWLKTPRAPTAYAAWWEQNLGSKDSLDKNLFLEIDLNRLDCDRTAAPDLAWNNNGVPEPLKEGEDLASWDLSLNDWAMLAGLHCVPQCSNGKPIAHSYTGRNKRGQKPKTHLVEPAKYFRDKVMAAAGYVKRGDTWYRKKPTPSAPYDVNATEEKVNFLDQVGALMKFWGHKHAHLERKKAPLLRLMKQNWTNDRSSPEWQHWVRLRTDLNLLNRRGDSIRKAFFEYMCRVVEYCAVRSGAKYIAHENLTLSPSGESGLNRIVASMFKDFAPVQRFLTRQDKSLGRAGSTVPVLKGVYPGYTSQVCNWCARRGVKGTLDDRGDSDWVICDTCGRIYDRHRNADANIGSRAIRAVYGEKKKGKTKRKNRR